jgi:steroid delta-isomerase-like uncharacterized protein
MAKGEQPATRMIDRLDSRYRSTHVRRPNPCGSDGRHAMTPHEHGQLFRKSIEQWNRGNVDFADELYAQNCSFHDPAFPAQDVSEVKKQGRQMHSAVPDLHMNVHEVLADGDMTAARWTMSGTHRGDLPGLPATGNSFTLTGVIVDKWEGDRIVEEWNNYDVASLLQQLGFMPDKAQMAEMALQRATR